jgi:hypothetical protein
MDFSKIKLPDGSKSVTQYIRNLHKGANRAILKLIQVFCEEILMGPKIPTNLNTLKALQLSDLTKEDKAIYLALAERFIFWSEYIRLHPNGPGSMDLVNRVHKVLVPQHDNLIACSKDIFGLSGHGDLFTEIYDIPVPFDSVAFAKTLEPFRQPIDDSETEFEVIDNLSDVFKFLKSMYTSTLTASLANDDPETSDLLMAICGVIDSALKNKVKSLDPMGMVNMMTNGQKSIMEKFAKWGPDQLDKKMKPLCKIFELVLNSKDVDPAELKRNQALIEERRAVQRDMLNKLLDEMGLDEYPRSNDDLIELATEMTLIQYKSDLLEWAKENGYFYKKVKGKENKTGKKESKESKDDEDEKKVVRRKVDEKKVIKFWQRFKQDGIHKVMDGIPMTGQTMVDSMKDLIDMMGRKGDPNSKDLAKVMGTMPSSFVEQMGKQMNAFEKAQKK